MCEIYFGLDSIVLGKGLNIKKGRKDLEFLFGQLGGLWYG